ncbi:TonB-dependent receptor [Mucilaginibacter paludis]|nr:TonB-dependent receptor [Mucilaginibacter paludis]
MKLTGLLLLVFTLHISASSLAQKASIVKKDAELKSVLRELHRQTGYFFIYNNEVIKKAVPVTVNLVNADINTILQEVFDKQPLTYFIDKNTILIKTKVVKEPVISAPSQQQTPQQLKVSGLITDDKGEPLAGATVKIKGSAMSSTADQTGHFSLDAAQAGQILQVSFVGYEMQEVKIPAGGQLTVRLSPSVGGLNEVLVVGYGTSLKKDLTGSVGRISAQNINEQAVANPLLALEGRIAGLNVTQTNGTAGAYVSVQIRGSNSIGAGNEPLYVIDGMPFESTPMNLFETYYSTANKYAGYLSPLSSINPGDIESIDVLKDADATAIYGSRGANGVILITTKKGKNTLGKLNVTVGADYGISQVAHQMDLLNTEQYLALRKQAFTNDGLDYAKVSAPDLNVFSPNQNTNWQKVLLGNNAATTNANIKLESGTEQSKFLFSTAYHNEGTVYPGSDNDSRIAIQSGYDFNSINQKFGISIKNNFSYDLNKLPGADLGTSILMAPNFNPYKADGTLNWQGLDDTHPNPLGATNSLYKNTTTNLISNVLLHYKVLHTLDLKLNLGYNQDELESYQGNPFSSFLPNSLYYPAPYAQFGDTKRKSFIIEPQAVYNIKLGEGKLEALAGGTFQRRTNNTAYIYGYNYSSDLLINSASAAGSTLLSNTNYDYRYLSVFGRINYNWKSKLIFNGTIRRDGSSRFGPDKQFGTFWSAGGAYVFSEEELFKKLSDILSFGKLRASYGTTGNDQIADYGYYSKYTAYPYTYQGVATVNPANLANSEYSWETVNKLDVALDLGFFHDRIFITADYYRNRTGNQLVGYPLSLVTGFSTVQYNLPAVIQNKGIELSLSTDNVHTANFSWKTSINFTIPRNTLLSYPGLAGSSNAANYVIGQSINIYRGYEYAGYNQTTGAIIYKDKDGSGTINTSDYVTIGSKDPKFYGGVQNTFAYGNWQLSFAFQYVKKEAFNYLYYTGSANQYGSMTNQDFSTLNNALVPRPTTSSAGYSDYSSSTATWGDASYLRLKNAYLSYNLPKAWLNRVNIASCNLYLQGQNLFTITNYKGLDPETLGLYTPPLRLYTMGIKVGF